MLSRPGRTLAAAIVVLALAIAAVTQLKPTASSQLLVSSHSSTGRAGHALDKGFGQEPIILTLKGSLQDALAPQDLTQLLALEGKLSRLKGVKAVYGPATFLNETVIQLEDVFNRQLNGLAAKADAAQRDAEAAARRQGDPAQIVQTKGTVARNKVLGPRLSEYRSLLTRLGSVGLPSLSNREFIQQFVYGAGVTPKRRFAWLFPDNNHELVLIRPKPGVSGRQALDLGAQIRRLAHQTKFNGLTAQVAGYPLLAAALEHETTHEIKRLAPFAILAMVLLLAGVALRRRGGAVLTLALALGALVVAIGLGWPLGLGLSVSTVAAMPVVLGLALDFAVQLQARYWAVRERGVAPREAAAAARREVGPTLGLAAGAMSAGFLVLLVSPVPLITRLGGALAVGTLSGLAVALLVGPSLLALADRGTARPLRLPAAGGFGRLGQVSLRAVPLTIAAAAAIAGLIMSGSTHVQSDVSVLAPHGLGELKAAQAQQRALGSSGQVSVAIQAKDVTQPATLKWLARFGAAAARVDGRLRPGPNLADLATGGDPDAPLSRQSVNQVLALLPRYFVDGVVTPDHRTAELTFGIPFVSVAEQGRLVDRIADAAGRPPAGVKVTTTGLVAEAAKGTRSLDDSRPWLLLLAALVVGGVLAVVWRRLDRVALVLGPALASAGLVALVLEILGTRLSPLGAALEPLVLAVGVEFAMLLDMRYRQARAAGRTPEQARADTTREIGAPVALSASTVAVGFLVLCLSRLPLLSQLGWLVALELVLCLAISLLLVPALAEALERPGTLRLPTVGPRRRGGGPLTPSTRSSR